MSKKSSLAGKGVPESLASLLTQVRSKIFDVGWTEMVEMLNRVARDPVGTARIPRHDDLKALEERERNLLFDNIESYSRLLGIPTAALSFVSRYQRESLDEAEAVALAMLDLVKDVRREGRSRFEIRDLHRLAHMIDLPNIAGRPQLPPINEDQALPSTLTAADQRRHRQGEADADTTPLFGYLAGNADDEK